MMTETKIETTSGYSLPETCAPVAWGGGRWPGQDWIDGHLIDVGQDREGIAIREVSQPSRGEAVVVVRSNRSPDDDIAWSKRVLATDRLPPAGADPVLRAVAERFPGMRPWSNGDLFEGVVTAIVGQSISVQAAAVTERKLCALFSEPVEHWGRRFWPMPTVAQLAEADPATIRLSGVTGRRATAIVTIAGIALDGGLISTEAALVDEAAALATLMSLPQVGQWTAESVLLWGLGVDDAYPVGDVALLRAARAAYRQPAMSHAEMNALAEGWRPARSWAARWLWLHLFGPAPMSGPPS